MTAKAWPPAHISPDRGRRTNGDQVAEFLESFCRITKDSIAGPVGQKLELRPWQVSLLKRLYRTNPNGLRKYRTALIGLPRKNGKSALLSGIALYELILGTEGGEVYACAADRDQARIVFGTAKRMLEMDPELSPICNTFRDTIEFPETGSIFRVLSAEAFTKEGLNPSFVAFDEVHAQPNRELWDVMQLAQGARRNPMLVGITTAGVRQDRLGNDTLCYGLYQYGKQVAAGEVDDPTFFFAWWEPKAGMDADHTDPATWSEANPGYGDLVAKSDFESMVARTPEAEFRTKRCNQWVSQKETWLPHGYWDAVTDERPQPPQGAEVVLGFDGSYSGDSTGLVGCTVDDKHLFVVESWEKKDTDEPDWRVPISEVEQAIRDACARWDVKEIACDPYRWARSMEALLDEGWPIVEFNTGSPGRMVPACSTFYDAVADKTLSHDGDPRLARHIDNCFVKIDAKGPRIVKENPYSGRKIDLAVCAVIAHERAAFWQGQDDATWFGGWA